MSGTAAGFAIVTGLVIVAVIIYTIIRLRKQVNKREKEERDKTNPK